MAPAPTNDPRIPPLVAAAVLASVLLLGGWPRPITGQAAAASPAVARSGAVAQPAGAGVAPPGAAAQTSGPAARPSTAQSGGMAQPGEAAQPGSTAMPSPGGWRSPLDGPVLVVRPFRAPANPYGPGHRGVDLGTSAGAAVRAAGAGVVSFAGLVAGRGVVTVTHGDLRTTYEPLEVLLVAAGERVQAGTPLGRLAADHPGCAASACLHWGLLRGSVYLSPLTLLLPDPPRLLPLT